MPSVNALLSDPSKVEFWGLDTSVRVSADKYPCRSYMVNGVSYEFYRHPYLFRSSHIIDWAEEYETFGLPTDKYEDCNPVWFELMKIYKSVFDGVVMQSRKEALQNG